MPLFLEQAAALRRPAKKRVGEKSGACGGWDEKSLAPLRCPSHTTKTATHRANNTTQRNNTHNTTKRNTGALQQVPQLAPPREQLASALKRAARVAPSAIKNEAERARNLAARQLDALMKELSVPLTKALAGALC